MARRIREEEVSAEETGDRRLRRKGVRPDKQAGRRFSSGTLIRVLSIAVMAVILLILIMRMPV